MVPGLAGHSGRAQAPLCSLCNPRHPAPSVQSAVIGITTLNLLLTEGPWSRMQVLTGGSPRSHVQVAFSCVQTVQTKPLSQHYRVCLGRAPCVSRRPGAAALQAGDSVPRGRFGGHFCREGGEVLQAPRDWRSEVLLKVPSLPSPHQE